MCVSLREKILKSFHNKVTKRGITTSKSVWVFIKAFLTDKGFLENKNITLIEENKIITSEKDLVTNFNEPYINIDIKSSGIKPKDISQRDKNQNIQKIIREIVKSYKNYPSILQIKNVCSSSFPAKEKFCFHFVNEIEIKNLYKGQILDTVPPKLKN